jgi:SPP1 family predicted phage head-tail adaptor
VNANDLKHLCELQSATQTVGGSGERTSTWSTYARIYAKIEPLSGRELERAKSYGSTVNHKITARYRPGITTDQRLAFRGRFFLINAVLNTRQGNRELVIMATEIVGGVI